MTHSELFTQLDAGVAALKQAQAQLRRYRQAVLKAVAEGELTREWREAHRGELEPASVLLARLLEEHWAKWEAEQLEKMRAKGKTPKDDKWKRKYKEPALPDTEDLPELPEGWVWATLEQLSSHIVDCLHSTPTFVSEGKYCIDTTCIEPARILFEKARFVSEETYNERVRRLVPEPGDVLFAREGTIGTAVAVPENVELCLGQRMMMFRPTGQVLSLHFMYSMLSPVFERQWKPKVTGTTAPHVNIGNIRLMSLPLPSVTEQQHIVSEAERRLSVIDEIEKAVEQSLKGAERLRQAVLKRAFEGKLVPQDPSDEPASALLARIQAEKARREAERKARKISRKKKSAPQLELL